MAKRRKYRILDTVNDRQYRKDTLVLDVAKEYKAAGYTVEVYEGERFKEEKIGVLSYDDDGNIIVKKD